MSKLVWFSIGRQMKILPLFLLLLLLAPGLAHAATETATAQVFHADPLDRVKGQARFITYALRDSGTRVLVASGATPYRTDIKHGDRVLVSQVQASTKGKGKVAGWVMVPLMQRAALAAPPVVSGQHKLAAIMIAFADAPAPTWMTQAQVRRSLFDDHMSVSAWFKEASYGLLNLTGDVYGPVTVPLSRVGCPYASAGSYGDQGVIAQVGTAKFSEYQHILYIFTGSAGCPWAGISTVGGSPSRSWAGGDSDVTRHELGHALGQWHSHSLLCVSVSVCVPGQVSDYGDTKDTMGSGGKEHFNAVQKTAVLGWLGTPGAPSITTVTVNGTYALEAYETPGPQPKALRVRTPSGDWYYAEQRATGLLVHLYRGENSNRIYLLDMTPDLPDWGRPWLPVGGTFREPSGISFTLTAPGQVTVAGLAGITPPPSGPAGPTALLGGPSLTWTAGVPATQTGFVVERALSAASPFVRIGTTVATSYVDASAVAGVLYCYRVLATSATETSEPSNTACMTPPKPGCPPDCAPPPLGDVTQNFTYTNTGKSQTFQVPDRPAPPMCDRITGGTRQLRIWAAGKVVKSVTADNPNSKGEAFSIRCFVNGASITAQLRVNGVLKASITK